MCLNHQFAQFDQNTANAFVDRLVNALNESAVITLLSIGHRTRLFDAMDGQTPMTSEALATRSGLNERYVREWLNGLVVGKIIHFNNNDNTYSLPPEHANFLTRRTTDGNLAVFAQYIPMMGTVEDDIIDCFKHGGGVSYDRFPRFHEVMEEDSGQTVLGSLEHHILPLVSGLPEKLQRGISVLDVGCGRGRAMNLLASLYPNSTFTGIDLSKDAIQYATAQAKDQGLNNVNFITKDLSDFDRDNKNNNDKFDLITTFDAIHDQAKPLNVLKGIFNALKDDGIYLMQDIHGSSHVTGNMEHPVGPLLYSMSLMHCMTVSLAQGGEGLGTLWGREKAYEYLLKAGFNKINVHRLEHDFQNDYYVIRK